MTSKEKKSKHGSAIFSTFLAWESGLKKYLRRYLTRKQDITPRKEFHRYLKTLVEAGFGKRILFGTDTPVWPGAVEESVLAIDEADFLTEEQKQDIFYNNAMRFFRWNKEDLKK